jgi:hypothetical protein
MAMVPTQRVVSNPFKAPQRIFSVFGDRAEPEPKSINRAQKEIFAEAKRTSADPRVKGSMLPYAISQDVLFQGLRKIRGERSMFVVNGVSPDRSPRRPYRYGTDVFNPMHAIAEEAWLGSIDALLRSERRLRPSTSVEELIGPHLVEAGQIFHFPAETLEDGDDLLLRHPYVSEIRNSDYLIGNRKGLGSLERRLYVGGRKKANTQYSEGVLSVDVFKDIIRLPDAYMDLVAELGSRDELLRQAANYIRVTREMVTSVTALFLEELQPSELFVYSMLTSATTRIWKSAAERAGIEMKIVGGEEGPMRNSNRSGLGELDPSAKNLMKGLLAGRYQRSTGREIQLPSKTLVPIRLENAVETAHCPHGSPWLLCHIASTCSGPEDKSCLKSDEDELNNDEKTRIKGFVVENKSGVSPIEAIINGLNSKDNVLEVDDRLWESWMQRRADNLLVPLALPNIDEITSYDVRASELTYQLDIRDALSKTAEQIREEDRQKMSDIEPFLIRGTLIHNLMLGGEQTVYSELLPEGFRIPRSEYCDQEGSDRKHLVYNFKPKESHFREVEDKLLKFRKRYDINGMLGLLEDIETERPTIVVSGHADAAGQIWSPDSPENERPITVLDVKTSMATSYQRKGVINQMLVYGMSIRQMLGREATTYLGAIPIYTRFSSNRLLPPEQRDMTDYGIFLKQKAMPTMIDVDSYRMHSMHSSLLELYLTKRHLGLIKKPSSPSTLKL